MEIKLIKRKENKQKLSDFLISVDSEEILSLLAEAEGYHEIANTYQRVVATKAQDIETTMLVHALDGRAHLAASLQVSAALLADLAAKLEVATTPELPEEEKKKIPPAILHAVSTLSDLSLKEVLFVYLTLHGVSKTLTILASLGQEMCAAYAQNSLFSHQAGKYKQLELSLLAARDRYQLCYSENPDEVSSRWMQEQSEDLAAQEELKENEGINIWPTFTI